VAGFFGGGCASCHYFSHSGDCSLRKFFLSVLKVMGRLELSIVFVAAEQLLTHIRRVEARCWDGRKGVMQAGMFE
jgi:hypothetical protein